MENIKQDLERILALALEESASDLHFSVGRYPTLRVDGLLVSLAKEQVVTPERSEQFANVLLTLDQQQLFLKEKDIDFSYDFKGKARFRVNVFRQRGFIASALRLIPSKIRTIEELALPRILHEFTKRTQGFLLVVGPAGHGKSTTLAAMIDEINHSQDDHIITIEDPV